MTKYCSNSSFGNNGFTDTLTTLEASDDVATVNWGSGWRMPTPTEMQELLDNCTITRTINGRLFTGPNGNSIFLPISGFRYDNALHFARSIGIYWTSSLNTSSPYAARALVSSDGCGMDSSYGRDYGGSVRPVCAQ